MVWVIATTSIIAYLAVGIVAAAVLNRFADDPWDGDTMMIGYTVITWPVLIPVALAVGLGRLVAGTVKRIERWL